MVTFTKLGPSGVYAYTSFAKTPASLSHACRVDAEMWGCEGRPRARGEKRENAMETANRRDKQSVFHFYAPVDRRNKPAKTCLLNTSLSLLSGCSPE